MSGHTPKSTRTEAEIAADVADKLTGRHQKWLENFAAEHDMSFTSLMDNARHFLSTGEDTHIGVDINYDAFPEFWDHFEQLTMEKVEENKRDNFFRCAC